ncbi:MAG: S9 family peptidase [Bryobacteraceae bacterium]
MWRVTLTVLTLNLASLSAASWTVADSFRLRRIAETTPAPDGSRVAWTETWAVMEAEKSEWRTQVLIARADGTGRRVLTRGDKGVNALRFSRDGHWLFFLAERGGNKNLFRIPLDGGEAEQLTDWKGALGGYAISPDGKQIALTAIEKDDELEKRKKEKDDWRVVDDKPRNHSLWLLPIGASSSGTSGPETPGPAKPKRLVATGEHMSNPVWSPDSATIACERRPRPEADFARHSDVVEVQAATGAVTVVSGTAATESDASYSPDGRFLAYLHHPGARIDGARVRLIDRRSGETRTLASTADEQPNLAGWTADSRSLLFTESSGTRAAVSRLPIDGPAAPLFAPAQGTISGVRLADGGSVLAFSKESPTEPAEAYALAIGGTEPVRLSAANTGLTLPAAPRTATIRWKSKDGLEIEGLLTYPIGLPPGAKAPLVLLIHGGPSGAWAQTYAGNPGRYPIALFASRGYAVLMPNPRGSSAYGLGFRQKVVQDWGGRDFEDLMAGVDHTIAMGLADPDKLAVMGWSYGGYMTAWTVTQTGRFKAAAMGAAITDHVSMYGTQDIPSVYEDYFGGPPWQHRDVYARSSPIQFVDRATTPMLILHGEDDHRVPVTQGYEFRRALERRGVPVRMVTYPRQGHAVTEPKLQRHVMEEHAAWADKYLGPDAAGAGR